jgi:exonuclease III
LSISHYNCRSVINKAAQLNDYIIDKDIDIIALTETWLSTDTASESDIITALVPQGYSFLHKPRQDKNGSGTGFKIISV